LKLKRKLPSTNPEAVRKRSKNLEHSPDFKVLLAKELEKASGGVECKECLAEARKSNEVLTREVELSRDYIQVVKEIIQDRKYCDERASLLKERVAHLQDTVKQDLLALDKKRQEDFFTEAKDCLQSRADVHW
jgi:hypothetical protein